MKEYFIGLNKNFPEAYKEMVKNIECLCTVGFTIPLRDSHLPVTIKIPNSLRDLYDFFDPLDIIMDVDWIGDGFVGYVFHDPKLTDKIEGGNRSQVEKEGFTKCFAILNERLTNKQIRNINH